MSRHPDRMIRSDIALNVSFNRGDASDRSMFSRTPTLANGATVSGRALVLDGTNDMLTFPDSASLDMPSAFTISAWVEPSSPGSAPRAIAGRYFPSGSNRSWYFGWRYDLAGTPLQFVVHPSGTFLPYAEYLANTTLPTSGWHHTVAVWNSANAAGSRAALYLDGSVVAISSVGSDGAYTPYDTGLITTIGAWGTAASALSPWKGNMDDFRIYRRALSAAEVGAIYASGRD